MGQENIGHIDQEIEEQLTEQLVDLYERWRSCSCGICTEDDKREAFFQAINGRLEKGFSILTKPGMYEDEKEMEKSLGKLYRTWKNYMKDCLGDGATIYIFIESAKSILDIAMEKGDMSWKYKTVEK
jgi:hypothetical protein